MTKPKTLSAGGISYSPMERKLFGFLATGSFYLKLRSIIIFDSSLGLRFSVLGTFLRGS